MTVLMLGVGDFGASKTPGDEVKTMALGSCISVIILDPKVHAVGMVHVALPEAKTNPDRARERPGYFADTGIPALLKAMQALGSQPTAKGTIIKLVGGASVMDPNNTFNIGKRNALAIKKILWGYGLGALKEDIGGHISRTVSVDVDCGKVKISSPGRDSWEI